MPTETDPTPPTPRRDVPDNRDHSGRDADGDGAAGDRPIDPRARFGRMMAAAAVLGLASMWIYVLFIADPVPKGKLEDPTFPRAAEPVCASALDDVGELPPARDARTANERADVVDRANARLDTMLDELDDLVPPDDAGQRVAEWLADWRVLLADRQDYADALRRDPAARFTVTAKYGTHISRAIDNWADINGMPSCRSFPDV